MMLTTQQAAERLAVHPTTIRRLVKSGKIKAVLLSNSERARFRIDEKELQAFIDGDSTTKTLDDSVIDNYQGTGL